MPNLTHRLPFPNLHTYFASSILKRALNPVKLKVSRTTFRIPIKRKDPFLAVVIFVILKQSEARTTHIFQIRTIDTYFYSRILPYRQNLFLAFASRIRIQSSFDLNYSLFTFWSITTSISLYFIRLFFLHDKDIPLIYSLIRDLIHNLLDQENTQPSDWTVFGR